LAYSKGKKHENDEQSLKMALLVLFYEALRTTNLNIIKNPQAENDHCRDLTALIVVAYAVR